MLTAWVKEVRSTSNCPISSRLPSAPRTSKRSNRASPEPSRDGRPAGGDVYNRRAMKQDQWRTWLSWGVLVALAAGLGVAIAAASSPGSLGHSIPKSAVVASSSRSAATDSRVAQPTSPPGPTTSGQLKAPVDLGVLGGRLYAFAADRAIVSLDGSVWQPLPAGPVVPDPSNPARFLKGGASIQVSLDAGQNWRAPSAAPSGGPFQPVAISPLDPAVWFVLHQGRLGRTRDSGVSWRDLTGLPALASTPTFVAGSGAGQFFLATQNRVFELVDNGQQVLDRGSVPGNSTVAGLVQAQPGSPGVLVARTTDGSIVALRNGSWDAAHPPVAGPISAAAGKLVLVADGTGQLGVMGQVASSTDGGGTWTSAKGLPTDQSVVAVAAEGDGQVAYAYCAGGDVYRSTDGALTWKMLSSSLRTG